MRETLPGPAVTAQAAGPGGPVAGLDGLMRWINEACPRLRIVPPQTKLLADGDYGVGGLAAVEEIVGAVQALLPPTAG